MTKKKKLKEQRRALRNNENLENEILLFLKANASRTFNHKQIASASGMSGMVAHKTVDQALRRLLEAGKVEQPERGKYRILPELSSITGRIEIMRDGFGFVRAEAEEKEIFIPARYTGKAFHGDTVSVRIRRPARGTQLAEGEVMHVVERGRLEFVGTVKVWDRMAYFTPDDPRIPHDFKIDAGKTMNAATGDKVLLKMLRWNGKSPEGEVVRVLGKAGEHETEMHAIILQFGFNTEFPAGVEEEAATIPHGIPAAEISKRRDFREVLTFTIDPIDAKDFDDALSIQTLPNGNLEIGVHIADVSYYVTPNTAIDKEAFYRATSVYLVDRTIPMLPEVLSNDLCSLKPNVDRLTFAAVFEFTPEGKQVNEWFGRTVIHSDKRFHYEEAQEILDKKEGLYFDELFTLDRIAKVLRDRRFSQGSINFEDDEVKFELDAEGKPIRVFRKIRKDTHKLIEDFMLHANRRVAEYVYKMRKDTPLPFIYRIHDWPDHEKLKLLREFVGTLGYDLDLSDDKTTVKSLNKLVTESEGKPEQHLIQAVAVRAMAKAIYSTNNIGHYGLAFEYYTHFTSPIRRYPDLMVHRMLALYLDKKFEGDPSKLDFQARHCSDMEKKAAEAERASVKYKQVEYLEDKVGQEFRGIISGVTNWGLYVELEESKSEGMVALAELRDDYYEVDQERYCIRGRSTGREIHLGDLVLVQVKSADITQRLIDFRLVEILEHRSGGGRNVKKAAFGDNPYEMEERTGGVGDILRKKFGKNQSGKSGSGRGKQKPAGKKENKKGGGKPKRRK